MFVSRKKGLLRGVTPDQRKVVIQQIDADIAGGEFVGTDFGHGRDFRRCTGNEALGKAIQFFRHNGTLDDL